MAFALGRSRDGEVFSAWQPAWSPDGKRLAFAGADYYANRVDVFFIVLDGTSSPVQVTHDPAGSSYVQNMDYAPTWTPDGTHLVYTFDPDGPSGFDDCNLGPEAGALPAARSLERSSRSSSTGRRSRSWRRAPSARTTPAEKRLIALRAGNHGWNAGHAPSVRLVRLEPSGFIR